MRKIRYKSGLSRVATLIFTIGLPVVAFVFFYILFSLINIPENQKGWLYAKVPAMLEYGIMCFALIFCGGLFTDIAVKKGNE